MKLSLRDLVWLMLLAAALVAFAREHQESLDERRRQQMQAASYMGAAQPTQPSDGAVARQAALLRLRALNDEQLQQRLTQLTATWLEEYEPCLTEMARRGLARPLQAHFDELQKSNGERSHQDLQALIAARRAEKLPDPLEIRVSIPSQQGAPGEPAPTIHATIANVDARRAAPNFQRGGDYRGGRLERWRVVLTDARGGQVKDSNFVWFHGGGISSYGPLEYGATADWPYDVDLRRYTAPPRSGKYQLQLFYHNDRSIAGEPDLTGLIVCRSEPLWVEVANPNDPRGLAWPAGLTPLLALAGACGLLLAASARWRARLSWRDWVWCAAILALGLGYYADCQYHATAIANLLPDAKAEWSIAPFEPGQR